MKAVKITSSKMYYIIRERLLRVVASFILSIVILLILLLVPIKVSSKSDIDSPAKMEMKDQKEVLVTPLNDKV
jgi:hypothetical protein